MAYFMHAQYQCIPYHNSIHAADVAQSIHVLVSSSSFKNVFTDLEIMAAIFAGAVHNIDHSGLTNQFLVDTGDKLTMMYHDNSVLENHHLAIAFKLLRQPGCDILAKVSKEQYQTFRKIVIAMVLATETLKHADVMVGLKQTVKTKKVAGAGLLSVDDRIQVLKTMILLSDLSNGTKPMDLFCKWMDKITEEFWQQGDWE